MLLSHGSVSSRQHIWTFAGALFQQSSVYGASSMPGSFVPVLDHLIPGLIKFHHLSVTIIFVTLEILDLLLVFVTLYPNDPLWDGAGCPSTSSCCEFNNPPWFNVSLPTPTTDDIEVRLCSGGDPGDDAIVNLMEVYVSK